MVTGTDVSSTRQGERGSKRQTIQRRRDFVNNSQVEKDNEFHEVRQVRMLEALPGFGGGKMPGRSKAEGGTEETDEENQVR